MLKISDHGGIFGGGKKITFGTAKASDVISGATVATEDGLITGTIPNRGGYADATSSAKWGDGALASYFPAGYYSGGINGGAEVKTTTAQLQQAEGNLHPNHILAGYPIFGVNGGIPNRSVENFHMPYQTLSPANGTGLYVQPHKGYYDGASWIWVNDNGFNSANIVAGKSIFGVAGSASVASMGGALKSSGTISVLRAGGTSTTTAFTFNLGFVPSVVIVHPHSSGWDDKYSIITPDSGAVQMLSQTSGGFGITLNVIGTTLSLHQNIVDSLQTTYYAFS